jgi:hypothetical protein
LLINTSKTCCGIRLATKIAASFPGNAPEIARKEVTRSVMKILKQFIFMSLIMIGLSMTATAQKQDDNKNRPPKDPPKIVAPDKERPPDKPKDDNNNSNRPKKPQDAIFVSENKKGINLV